MRTIFCSGSSIKRQWCRYCPSYAFKGNKQKDSFSHILCIPSLRGIKFPGTSVSWTIVAVALVTPEVPAWSNMSFSIQHSHSVFGIKGALCVKSFPVTQQSPSHWTSSCFPSQGIAWDQLAGILSGLYRPRYQYNTNNDLRRALGRAHPLPSSAVIA